MGRLIPRKKRPLRADLPIEAQTVRLTLSTMKMPLVNMRVQPLLLEKHAPCRYVFSILVTVEQSGFCVFVVQEVQGKVWLFDYVTVRYPG
jgi:hypothetical protein